MRTQYFCPVVRPLMVTLLADTDRGLALAHACGSMGVGGVHFYEITVIGATGQWVPHQVCFAC